MGLFVGSVKPKIYIGNTKVRAVYVGSTKVWSGAEPFVWVITASQVVTIPDGVEKVDVFLVGGGGCGGWGNRFKPGGGGGGGGGYTATYRDVAVTPGQQLAAIIGAGGTAPAQWATYSTGGDGGSTHFGGLSVAGGKGGWNAESYYLAGGGHGGSGGGFGSASSPSETYNPGNHPAGAGASDGATAERAPYNFGEQVPTGKGGTGQSVTTRAFGEAWNTLYAGGGGGGNCSLGKANSNRDNWWWYDKAAGAAGAGGSAPNTGGGGEGGFGLKQESISWHDGGAADTPGAPGYSGVVIVRFNG